MRKPVLDKRETGLDITSAANKVRFPVYAAPRASKTEVIGVMAGALKIKLKAAPVDGAANEELIACLAKFFHASKSDISIIKGLRSKRKLAQIAGLKKSEVLARVELKKVSSAQALGFD